MPLYAQVPLYFSEHLPKDRPYTQLEAAFQYDVDRRFNSKERSKLEYSKIWGWDWGKVDRFIKEINKKGNENELSFTIKTQPKKNLKSTGIDKDIKHRKNEYLRGVSPNLTPTPHEQTQTLYIEDKEREQHLSLFDLWNEAVTGTSLPTARTFSKSRQSKCITRMKERSFEDWKEVFRLIAASPFLCGQGPQGWKADFDWIISNEGNAEKVLEGKYQKSGKRAANSDNRYSMFAGA